MGVPPSLWQESEYRKELRDYRAQLNGYYEKLALLNGGTIALVVTGVFGPFYVRITHRHTLLAALTVQILALLALLYRNLRAIQYEQASTAVWHRETRQGNDDVAMLNTLLTIRQRLETVGQWLTGLGMLLLVVNAWLIFW
jgi:hypothetical protein